MIDTFLSCRGKATVALPIGLIDTRFGVIRFPSFPADA